MSHAKKALVAFIAFLIPAIMVTGSAQAANEQIATTTNITSNSGGLFKEYAKPVSLTIDARVSNPATETRLTPLKQAVLDLPKGVTFNPNNSKTPVCPDSKFGPTSDFSLGPKYFVDQCGSSVIGTGDATIYAAKVKANRLTDPVLIVFNAGKDKSGNAMIKIYGYSKLTGAGIYMSGTLKGNVLNMSIPALSYDSSIEYFTLNFPGEKLDRPDMNFSAEGHDPNYVKATCATGTWTTSAQYTLVERDPATGVETTTPYSVDSPDTTQNCTGAAGTAKVKVNKVKGPKAVKAGKKGSFKVTVTNPGTATAKSVVVTATGGGKAKGGNIAPGATKTVTVKTKVSGKKGKKTTIKFTVKGGKAKTTAKAKVKVS